MNKEEREQKVKELLKISRDEDNPVCYPKIIAKDKTEGNSNDNLKNIIIAVLGVLSVLSITLLVVGSTVGLFPESTMNVTSICEPQYNLNTSLKCPDFNVTNKCSDINISLVCGSYNSTNYTVYNYTNST